MKLKRNLVLGAGLYLSFAVQLNAQNTLCESFKTQFEYSDIRIQPRPRN